MLQRFPDRFENITLTDLIGISGNADSSLSSSRRVFKTFFDKVRNNLREIFIGKIELLMENIDRMRGVMIRMKIGEDAYSVFGGFGKVQEKSFSIWLFKHNINNSIPSALLL